MEPSSSESVDETQDYNDVRKELKSIDALIGENNEELENYERMMQSVEIQLKSLLANKLYDNWSNQIKILIELLQNVYNYKITPLRRMMEQLQTSHQALISPIEHERVILLGKTRSGKSNFGNAMLDDNVFKTSDKMISCTKLSKNSKIIWNKNEIEFIDTQGLDDTDNPDEVLPKLQSMIKEINWQYTSVFYLLRYESLTLDILDKVLKFLQGLFGNNVVNRAILIITVCPMSKRFQSFDSCKNTLISEFTGKPEVIRILNLFNGIKFVNLDEPNDEMDEDEKELIIAKGKKERKIILDDLIQRKFGISHPGFLKQFILKFIYSSMQEMKELKQILLEAKEMFSVVTNKDNIRFAIKKS